MKPLVHVALFVFGALAWGCGPELERVSELRGLRILAVQKDTPYAAPEAEVEFRMLWEDGAGETPRQAERFWIGGCENPPGDLYVGCFGQWGPAFATGGDASHLFGDGDRFITKSPPIRPLQQDRSQPAYGIGYVFFGVCAGQVDWVGWFERMQTGTVTDLGSALPYCVDPETREPLGPNDYVVGYSALYSYADPRFRNRNPVIGIGPDPEAGDFGPAFRVGGVDVAYDCIGEECVCEGDTDAEGNPCRTPFPAPALTGCVEGVACIESCADDGEPSCPGIEIRPLLDQARNAEPDTVAQETFGRQVEEAMWISYFVDRGSVRSDLRLLNDGAEGWNEAYGTELYAPREPGPLRIWAVVRDNRGGVNWVRVPAYVR